MMHSTRRPLYTQGINPGDTVELHGLEKSADLNGVVGIVLRFDETVKRWHVKLGRTLHTCPAEYEEALRNGEIIRARTANLRRDQLLAHERDGTFIGRYMRSEWCYPDDPETSAAALLAKFAMEDPMASFSGTIRILVDDEWRDCQAPKMITLPSAAPLWDPQHLIEAVQEKLPPGLTAKPADIAWDAEESDFNNSMTEMVLAAHKDASTVQIAIRTAENTWRFTWLHMLMQENVNTFMSLLGMSTTVCRPTEAIAFHLDNLVKLPTSMSQEQAVRKVIQMVNGDDTCPICLDSLHTDTACFVPCPCRASIHLKCLVELREGGATACPVCRGAMQQKIE